MTREPWTLTLELDNIVAFHSSHVDLELEGDAGVELQQKEDGLGVVRIHGQDAYREEQGEGGGVSWDGYWGRWRGVLMVVGKTKMVDSSDNEDHNKLVLLSCQAR